MLLLIKLEISKTYILKTDLEWCKLQSTQKRKAYDIKSFFFFFFFFFFFCLEKPNFFIFLRAIMFTYCKCLRLHDLITCPFNGSIWVSYSVEFLKKKCDIKSYQFYELKGIIVIIVFHISNISHYLMILSRCYYKSSVICPDYLFLLFFVST